MQHTVTRAYQSYAHAKNVVEAIESAKIPGADISIVAHDGGEGSNAAGGAGIGGAIGGAAGLLAGIGLLAIPGIGPVVAAGWLASTAAGATVGAMTGGLVGALTTSGVDEEDAHYYAETLRRGGAVVSTRVSDPYVDDVEAIMDRFSPYDKHAQIEAYRSTGWKRFDETQPPYTR